MGTSEVKRILDLEGVARTVGHQCQYSAVYHGNPIKKPTGFMSNSPEIRRSLSKVFSGRFGQCGRPAGGEHILRNGRVARMAAIFPVRLCKAILSGFQQQLKKDGIVHDGTVGMNEADQGKDDEVGIGDGSVMSVCHVASDEILSSTMGKGHSSTTSPSKSSPLSW